MVTGRFTMEDVRSRTYKPRDAWWVVYKLWLSSKDFGRALGEIETAPTAAEAPSR